MRIPKLTLPILVIAALVGGYFLRFAFTQPSTAVVLGDGGRSRVECIVDGVKCKGTASLFTTHMQTTPGIHAIETFASDHRAVLSYDPDVITPEQIRAKIDAPVALDDSTHVAFFKCVSMDEPSDATETPTTP